VIHNDGHLRIGTVLLAVPLSVPVLRPVQVGHTAELALALLRALDLRSCLLKFAEYRPN
jgi:hypothetical protein